MEDSAAGGLLLLWLHLLVVLLLLPPYTMAERPLQVEKFCGKVHNITDDKPLLSLSYEACHMKQKKCQITVQNVAKSLTSICVESDSRTFYPDCETTIIINSSTGVKKEYTCKSENVPDICSPARNITVIFERKGGPAKIKYGFVEIHVVARSDVRIAVPGSVIVALLCAGVGVVVVTVLAVVGWLCCRRRLKKNPHLTGATKVLKCQENLYSEITTDDRTPQTSEKLLEQCTGKPYNPYRCIQV